MANKKIIERKQQTVEEIIEKTKNSSCVVLFENQGLTVSETNELRKELRKRNIKKLKVVYSKEEPIKVKNIDTKTGKNTPGSVSFVPSVAGLTIAGEIVRDILKMK